MRNPSGSAGQGVPLTWSAPARLQACSSTWSSSAAAIAAGYAGHLVDQFLAADLVPDTMHRNAQHYAPGCATYARPPAGHTQTRHKHPHKHKHRPPGRPAAAARALARPAAGAGLARSTTPYRIRPDHAPGANGRAASQPTTRQRALDRTGRIRRGDLLQGRRTAAGAPGARCRPSHAPGEGVGGGRGATSPVPPDFGGPLRASGLCRGLCCDAEGRPGSQPAAAGLRRNPGRMVLMRIDARTGAFSTPGEGPGRREGLKPTHRQNFVDSWIGLFPSVTL